jgi:serine/threonine-protein kinase
MAASPLQAHSLGSYHVIRKLGSGGMAEVFLAAHHMAGDVERLVVVKAMLPHLADDDRFVQMFLREARIAALLSHPNVIQIHDVSVIENRPCIVMEFLRGRDLWHVLRRFVKRDARVRPEAAAAIVAQAASGLDYAHRKRDDRGQRLDLVHRDISPHNLFLTREGHVRVLDFGIAKSAYQQQRTQSGVLKGKLPYMAPEQARGKEIDGRADQFALGVILWEMLTGRRLFAREDPFQTMNSLFHMPVPVPSQLFRDLPVDLDAICLRALDREPEGRYESCEDFANALRDWMRSVTSDREPSILASALEEAIPAAEDRSFYGFDPDSTATSVLLPEGAVGGIHDLQTELRDGTPSRSEIKPTAPAISVAPTAIGLAPESVTFAELEPEPEPEAPRRWVVGGALAFAALLAMGIGVAFAVLGTEDESYAVPLEPAGPPPDVTAGEPEANAGAEAESREIAIRFLDVPDGVALEIDGARLEGTELRTLASDEVRHVRALRDDREVWRYDGIFRETTEVALPTLPEVAVAREPGGQPVRETRTRTRSRDTRRQPAQTTPEPSVMRTRPRLDNSLDLGYP